MIPYLSQAKHDLHLLAMPLYRITTGMTGVPLHSCLTRDDSVSLSV